MASIKRVNFTISTQHSTRPISVGRDGDSYWAEGQMPSQNLLQWGNGISMPSQFTDKKFNLLIKNFKLNFYQHPPWPPSFLRNFCAHPKILKHEKIHTKKKFRVRYAPPNFKTSLHPCPGIEHTRDVPSTSGIGYSSFQFTTLILIIIITKTPSQQQENVDVIEPDMWPPNSPDLNPVDYAIWGALQQRVYLRREFSNVAELKQAIVYEWGKLSQGFIDKSIDQWRRRLACVVQQNGGHIEHLFV